MLSEVLDKKLSSTIEGQSFAAPIMLVDKLKEDGKGLERRAVRAASRHARQSRQQGPIGGCGRIRRRERAWHRSK